MYSDITIGYSDITWKQLCTHSDVSSGYLDITHKKNLHPFGWLRGHSDITHTNLWKLFGYQLVIQILDTNIKQNHPDVGDFIRIPKPSYEIKHVILVFLFWYKPNIATLFRKKLGKINPNRYETISRMIQRLYWKK